MPIQISCPDCGKKYRLSDERAGSTVECKECGSDIDVPGGSRRRSKVDDDDDDVPSPSRRRPRKPGKSKKSSGGAVGLLIAGGIGGFVIVALLLVVLLRRPAANNGGPVAGPSVAPNAAGGNAPSGNAAPGTSTEKLSTVAAKGWKAKVDPSPNPTPADQPSTFKIELKAENGVDERFVMYPDVASTFVLVGDPRASSKQPREIWNLVTGSKVRDVPPLKNVGSNVGFSTDGKLLAWYRHENGGGLDVYDTEAGKITTSIPLPSGEVNVSTVAIPSPQRLMIASTVHRKLMTWKLPSGEAERTIALGQNGQPNEQLAFSPGGRYVAFTGDFLAQSLEVYDLETGELAGTIEFSQRMLNKALVGLQFSPDGSELAAAFGQNHGATSDRILILSVANGSTVADFSLPDPDQRPLEIGGNRASLQWFSDRKRLLQNGRHIIDRDAKKVIYSLPAPLFKFDSRDVRRVLPNSTIVSFEGEKNNALLVPMTVTESDIARAREVAASGGLIVDAKLPKLTALDRKRAPHKNDNSTTWKVLPDPCPSPATLTAAVTLPDASGRARELKLSRLDTGRAAIRLATGEDDTKSMMAGIYPRLVQAKGAKTSRPRYTLEPVTCQQNWLEVVDLVGGKPLGRVDVAFACELLALSPAGTRALVAPMEGQGRLDVISIPDGAHVAGCRPFSDETEPELRHVNSVAFIDENTIAATNVGDQLVVFKLPGCEPIYTVQDAGLVTVSPGGKLLATFAEGKIEFRDALTGEGRGSTNIDGPAVAMSFSTAGDRLAVVTYAANRSSLQLVDLTDGAVTSQSVPASQGPVLWINDQQLLVGKAKPSELIHRPSGPSTIDRDLMLVDLRRQAVLWSYQHGTGDNVAFERATTDNHLWVAGPPQRGRGLKVTGLTLPEPTVAARLTDQAVESQLAVKPGMAVSLQFGITDPPEAPGIAKQLQDVVDATLRANGLTVQNGQPIKLTVSSSVVNVPGTLELQMFGTMTSTQPNRVSIQPKKLTLQMTYEQNGKPIWEAKKEMSNAGGGIVRIENNKQPQQAIDEQMWKLAVEGFREIQPLSHILSGATDKGLGTSRLAGDGVHPPGK